MNQTTGPSEVVKTILSQLRALGIFPGTHYKLAMYDGQNPNKVTLHKPGRGRGAIRNIEIVYNEGTDLYDIKDHRINPQTYAVNTKELDGMYAESLVNLWE